MARSASCGRWSAANGCWRCRPPGSSSAKGACSTRTTGVPLAPAPTSARLLEITRQDFEALLARHPSFAYELLRQMSFQLRAANDATINDLQKKNRQLTRAYEELQAAQSQLIEKEKLEHELQMAREMQEQSLPRRMPNLPGFSFGARLAPARLVSGDVCGKGVPAAFFAAQTRSLLRGEAVFIGRGLGHPLGILPEPAFEEHTSTLPPGATLLIYTDGVTEAMDARGSQFGATLLRATAGLPQPSPQALCDHLLDTIRAFHGDAPQDDDVTLVAVRGNDSYQTEDARGRSRRGSVAGLGAHHSALVRAHKRSRSDEADNLHPSLHELNLERSTHNSTRAGPRRAATAQPRTGDAAGDRRDAQPQPEPARDRWRYAAAGRRAARPPHRLALPTRRVERFYRRRCPQSAACHGLPGPAVVPGLHLPAPGPGR
jgi:hypothetical protein